MNRTSMALIVALLVIAPARAQDGPAKPPAPPVIVAVKAKGKHTTAEDHARLNQSLVITVRDPQKWVETIKPKNIVLYLNGRPITKLAPYESSVKPGEPPQIELTFDLARTKDNKDAWTALLGELPLEGQWIGVNIGTESAVNPASESGLIYFDVWVWDAWTIAGICIFGLATAVMLFWMFSCKSEVLRDKAGAAGDKPLSLARCQMALWFYLHLAAFILIWCVMGDPATGILTMQSVILMGIGTATAVSARSVDQDKTRAQQATNAAPQPPKARGFISDLLSNSDGLAYHRLQMFVWTIVLATVFVHSVVIYLKIPEFDASLLVLMGISGTTYVGFKFSEPPKPP